jgi:hypothetical protein
MKTVEIELYGVKLTAYYTTYGKYYPATHYEPEEHPDITIEKVCATDSEIDLMDILGNYEDEIYDLIGQQL